MRLFRYWVVHERWLKTNATIGTVRNDGLGARLGCGWPRAPPRVLLLLHGQLDRHQRALSLEHILLVHLLVWIIVGLEWGALVRFEVQK